MKFTPAKRLHRAIASHLDKLLKTLEPVRAQNVEGIAVFSTSGLMSGRLWDALGQFFGK